LYTRVIRLYPGLNLFEILIKIFGAVFGRILSFIFVFYAIHRASIVIHTYVDFIHIFSMDQTPEILTVTFIILLSIWSVKSGPENIARVSRFTWTIVAASVVLTFIIAVKDMDLNNLKPVMETDPKSLLSVAFSLCMLPLGEIIVCLSFFSAVDSKVNPSKTFIVSLVTFALVVLISTFRNILVLGIPTALLFYYPSYQAVSIISIGDFFSRVEVLIGVNLLLGGFIKICIFLYASSLGVTKIINIQDQKMAVVPCGLLIATLSTILYTNSQQVVEWYKVIQIYSIPFELIFPMIIWIGAEIQNKIKSAGTAGTKGASS